MTDKWQAPAPPRGNNYASGRTKTLISVAVIGGVLLVFLGARYMLARHGAPQPTKAVYTGNPGVYPGDIVHPSYRHAVSTGNDDFRYRQPAAPTAQPDPELTSSSNVANDGTGGDAGLGQAFAAEQAAYHRHETAQDGVDDDFSKSLQPSNTGGMVYARVDRDGDYEVSKGRVIPCATNFAVNSELPGFITCTIEQAVMNDTGTAAVIPKGSFVTGQIQHAVMVGNDRLAILWTDLRTSDDPQIKVQFHSPAADALGRPGMPVAVNNHLLSAFLATLTYSMIEYGPQLLNSAIQSHGGNNSLNFYQSFQPQQGLAARILDRYMSQPPTGEANQAQQLLIVVGQDMNFRRAIKYQLAPETQETMR